MTEAYPLHWPVGKPRTKWPQSSRFTVGRAVALDNLFDELRMLGAQNIVVSTDIELRLDGHPYASRRPPDDKGVAVYFSWKKRQMCFACDQWDKIEHNIHAVGKTIGALRGIERWASGDMVEAAFTGFQALPPPMNERPWWTVLNLPTDSSLKDCENVYRHLAKKYHPDSSTGSTDKMSELNAAIAEVRKRKS